MENFKYDSSAERLNALLYSKPITIGVVIIL